MCPVSLEAEVSRVSQHKEHARTLGCCRASNPGETTMRNGTVLALLAVLSLSLGAREATFSVPGKWDIERRASSIGTVLDTSAIRDNAAIKGVWEVSRKLGDIAHDPSAPVSCAFRHFDTSVSDRGRVRFTVLVDGDAVHSQRVVIGADVPRAAQAAVAGMDLTDFGADTLITCRAKVQSPTRVMRGSSALLSLNVAGSLNGAETRFGSVGPEASPRPASSVGPRRVPTGWTMRAPRHRSAVVVTARATKKSTPAKGKWVAHQRLGQLAGGAFAQLICGLRLPAASDYKGKAVGVIKVDGRQVFRKSVGLEASLLFLASLTDLSDYDADAEVDCTVTVKGTTKVPTGTVATVQTSVSARVD